MRRVLLGMAAIVAMLVIAFGILWKQKGIGMFVPAPGNQYPAAPKMPPVAAKTVDDLLARYERLLAGRAPRVLAALQPGLTDAEIDALESKHGFRLPPDLRSLYRWRNGNAMPTSPVAFPDHRFVPLDQALAERDQIKQQVRAGTAAQQAAFATFADYRGAWLGLVVDLAGDGYFFDPNRSEAEGSFFYHFAENGTYVFFPAFRNYLAAVVEGVEVGVFGFDNLGSDTADLQRAQALWRKYGAENTW
jgi:cell wall assembly regulator SMI1